MNKELTFKDVYRAPFHICEFCPIYMFSANNVTAFNVITDDIDVISDILEIINGNSKKNMSDNVTFEDGYILIDGEHVLRVRGWGHLTGCGALNLPVEKAAKIQDDFANWVVNKLKGK